VLSKGVVESFKEGLNINKRSERFGVKRGIARRARRAGRARRKRARRGRRDRRARRRRENFMKEPLTVRAHKKRKKKMVKLGVKLRGRRRHEAL
jgi:hypothetical protein